MTRRVHGRTPSTWFRSPSHRANPIKEDHFIVNANFQTNEVTCFCSHVAVVSDWAARVSEWDQHMRDVRATAKAERDAAEATSA